MPVQVEGLEEVPVGNLLLAPVAHLFLAGGAADGGVVVVVGSCGDGGCGDAAGETVCRYATAAAITGLLWRGDHRSWKKKQLID